MKDFCFNSILNLVNRRVCPICLKVISWYEVSSGKIWCKHKQQDLSSKWLKLYTSWTGSQDNGIVGWVKCDWTEYTPKSNYIPFGSTRRLLERLYRPRSALSARIQGDLTSLCQPMNMHIRCHLGRPSHAVQADKQGLEIVAHTLQTKLGWQCLLWKQDVTP